ncbi:ABC transporter permease [Acetobacter nitrogenifigens DSM 23921 = NBRC 105050]|uniref:ABC transporter permease n=1 Tax=Acetobacter nitrogenifigens DSM 23921 = NBRC 105050 TaxID=1120919 RepID=A0A511X9Q1_9PROT|nr:ABC transporter permease [Acetobacter nitrogenifigens]GBQ93672.1 ABC transporter permease [Acetobacter nitrogenifigens DSM 23921 = NBRC 105050]GEN59641.1 ABC transporter permease [Acetobacter nitrogenifigens DSM 23921 = NBRC 105050]
MNALLDLIAVIGRHVLEAARGAGALAMFAVEGLLHAVRPPFYWRVFGGALMDTGYLSLPVVAMTALFAGGVIALQSYTGFAQYHVQSAIAGIVVLSVTRELGPVLAGLMVAGRVGAAMAAQIGTMRVTDQIDALTTLRTSPMKYLVTPRLLAGLISLPLLVVVADILGVAGGFTVSVVKLGFAPAAYISATINAVKPIDITVGLVKAAVFGFIIALMGCYYGYSSRGGAEGVGSATTSAVVSASILVLAFDYLLTDLFFAQ